VTDLSSLYWEASQEQTDDGSQRWAVLRGNWRRMPIDSFVLDGLSEVDAKHVAAEHNKAVNYVLGAQAGG
jgi:hypothetical protein